MHAVIGKLFTVAVLAIGVAGAPSSALADWMKAESERFIVYSEGSERELRAYVQELESLDRVLRQQMSLDEDAAPPRKLPIYLVTSRDLRTINPNIGRSVAGFYAPTSEDIFAVGLRGSGNDFVLRHEYAHHFMLQNFAYGYPAWFVEGFAEYYMTTEINEGRVALGRFQSDRAMALLSLPWPDMDDLLRTRPGEMRRRGAENYYPVAWALTHWFMTNPERRARLNAYMLDVGAGGDPVEAMQRATGLDPVQLQREVRDYVNGRMSYFRMDRMFPTAAMTVTTLDPVADDLLLMSLRLKLGVPEDERPATAAEVRELAARHPDHPFARLQLAHAELHFGERERGVQLLEALITDHPGEVEALQLLAGERLRLASEAETEDQRTALLIQARRHLRQAYALDDADYRTLHLLAQSRVGAAGYPDENDMATWATAYHLAPQLPSVRMGSARALISAGRDADAIALLRPLANNPHGQAMAEQAQALIDETQSRLDAAAQD